MHRNGGRNHPTFVCGQRIYNVDTSAPFGLCCGPVPLSLSLEIAVRGTIKKWGNSLAVRLPASVVQATTLREDSAVEIEGDNGVIVIKQVEAEYELGELVAQITPENRHDEADFGGPVGKETL